MDNDPNGPARGSMTPEMRMLGPTLDAYGIIEQALVELGVSGPASRGKEFMFSSRAEEAATAIVARLANNDPPILLHYVENEDVHPYVVTVGGCTQEQADQVIRERIDPDEDYGFDYTIYWTRRY